MSFDANLQLNAPQQDSVDFGLIETEVSLEAIRESIYHKILRHLSSIDQPQQTISSVMEARGAAQKRESICQEMDSACFERSNINETQC